MKLKAIVAAVVATTSLSSAAAPTIAALGLTVNGIDKGVVPMLLGDKNQWLISQSTLKSAGVLAAQAPINLDGEPYFYLNDIKGVAAVVDEASLTASLIADPTLLGEQSFSLLPKGTSSISESAPFSGYLNYNLGVYPKSNTKPSLALDGILNFHDWALSGKLFYQKNPNHNVPKSFLLSHDWPSALMRLEIGDLPSQSLVPGQALSMRGISVTRAFDTQPYFQKAPAANFTGAVGVPAIAEVRVDGQLIRTIRLEPGTFNISSLAYRTGLHDAIVVVRDKEGNVLSTLGGPIYFAASGLAKGISDYGFSIGKSLSDLPGAGHAFSARYAYGISDAFTFGAFTQGEGNRKYLGLATTVTAAKLGTASAQVIQSPGAMPANAALLQYGWQNKHLSISLGAERYSRTFFGDGLLSGISAPASSFTGSIGYSLKGGKNITFSASSRKFHDETAGVGFAMDYSQSLKNATLGVRLSHTGGNIAGHGTAASVFLNWSLGHSVYRSASVAKGASGYSARVDTTLSPADDIGFGYRAGVQVDNGKLATLSMQYGMREALFSTNMSYGQEGSSVSAYASSSVAFVGSNFAFSRSSRDSFVIADVGVPNVRVLRNNQIIGTTGKNGKVFIPYLAPYGSNQLSVDEQDLPDDYSLDQTMKIVVPHRHAGSIVKFALKRIRASGGELMWARPPVLTDDAATKPDVRSTVKDEAGNTLPIAVHSDNTFYFDDLPKGTWSGAIKQGKYFCKIRLSVPERHEPYLDLGKVNCENK